MPYTTETNRETSKLRKKEGRQAGREAVTKKRGRVSKNWVIGQDMSNSKSLNHLACRCVRILCACTQFHAHTQRVSEYRYTHEYVYVYVFVQCVCLYTCMCLCLCDITVCARLFAVVIVYFSCLLFAFCV